MQLRTRFLHAVLASAALAILAFAPGCGGSKQAPPPAEPSRGSQPDSPAATAPAPAPAPASAPAAPKPTVTDPDKPVATVNGVPIRKKKVYELAEANKARRASTGQPLPPDADRQLRQGALDLLINGELMIQSARSAGMKADPQEVDALMQKARSGFPSEQDFKKYLADAGITEAIMRAEAEERTLMTAYIKAATAGVKVPEEIGRKFYEENKSGFKRPDEAHVLQILVRTSSSDPAAKRDEARKRIDEAYAKAKTGEDFAALAKQYSQAPNAAKGGDVGFIPHKAGPIFPKFDEMAFATPPGQISEVFETPMGFNIIKVIERREGKTPAFDEVKAPLLMKMTELQEGAVLQQKLRELRSTAKVAILDPELIPPPPEAQAPAGQPAPPPGK